MFASRIKIHDKAYQKLRQEIGMVFQHFSLFPHLTACQNIRLAPKMLKEVGQLGPVSASAIVSLFLQPEQVILDW